MLNEMIVKYCELKGFIYLDYFKPMANNQNGMREDLTTDGVHCNVKGYKVMEPLAKVAIQQALIHQYKAAW